MPSNCQFTLCLDPVVPGLAQLRPRNQGWNSTLILQIIPLCILAYSYLTQTLTTWCLYRTADLVTWGSYSYPQLPLQKGKLFNIYTKPLREHLWTGSEGMPIWEWHTTPCQLTEEGNGMDETLSIQGWGTGWWQSRLRTEESACSGGECTSLEEARGYYWSPGYGWRSRSSPWHIVLFVSFSWYTSLPHCFKRGLEERGQGGLTAGQR